MSNINYTSSTTNQYTLNESQEIKNSIGNYSLSTKYHQSEIGLNAKLINSTIKMIWVGIFLLAIGLIISIFTDQNFISLIPGAFIDIFSGTIIHLVNKSSENKQKYFENLSLVEHEERIIELIHNSNNSEFKETMISKLVDKHCKN